MTIKFIKKYYVLITALIISIVFCAFYYRTYTTNYGPYVEKFNQQFLDYEKQLDDVLKYKAEDLKLNDIDQQWWDVKSADDINIHIYRNDSLKYWNTNQLPIIRFADIHFPAQGILHLQNGWYYAKIKEVNDYLICGSFLIRNDFAYENKDLNNEFKSDFDIPFDASINIDQENGFPVKDSKGIYIFSIIPDEVQTIGHSSSVVLTCLLVFMLMLWVVALARLRKRLNKIGWLIPIAVVGVRLVSINFGLFGFLKGNEALDPSLYGANYLFPNYLDYLINVVIIVYLLSELRSFLEKVSFKKGDKILGYTLFVGSIFIWSLLLYLTRNLVENSTISMSVNQLFTLSTYSILAIASLGILFYSYFQFLIFLVKTNLKKGIELTHLAVLTFILGCAYFLYQINTGDAILFASIFPLVLYGIALYRASKKRSSGNIAFGLILLFLFSAVMSATLDELIQRKEKSERELYANQLATEKSLLTEVEYDLLADKLVDDNFLKRFIGSSMEIGVSDFQENLERRFFNGFWERYEMDFHLFDAEHMDLVDGRNVNTEKYEHFEEIIKESGTASEVNPNIFYINDYRDQYSYIIRQEIRSKDSMQGFLFCTLKSKKIPEEIGFPRLLISSKANVIESLESYSIARYRKGRLLNKYGDFNFPSSYTILSAESEAKAGFIDYGGYNHFVLKKSSNNVVVLSQKHQTWVDLITSFSYLFSFYGLLILPFLFRGNNSEAYKRTFSLAMKIQVVLISLVFLSLLGFGWGSGVFVSNQYNEFTNDVIREKLNSVEKEVKAKLGEFERLSIDENGDYMQYILQKFAKVFFTDINLYDTDGYLLATSRPKVFNVGLISEQMNPEAFNHLKYGQRSEFVHSEYIGNLDYSSAYQPFYYGDGQQLAYINLQHFGQQREFENQIEKFLVAIINVFILLLAVSIILAIFISNWLTSPLRILQENFAHVRFGKRNERISYDKEDEIGALVKEYNQKLDELDYTANQLAKSERESAWREMAKQVAHEIKNPLTPMKLSVQQLLRSFNPDDPKSKEKLERVANSIVEQIDALTKIANEFSNFAKMPKPSEEKLNIVHLINSVIGVFENQAGVKITAISNKEELFILADKDQMMRVINNLLKNAIQAIPKKREGKIDIEVAGTDTTIKIIISDNGIGISKEEYSKLFVPYFTTKSTGTGLGLAMVKQIIENHRGSIDLDSIPDKGTTFIIELPIVE